MFIWWYSLPIAYILIKCHLIVPVLVVFEPQGCFSKGKKFVKQMEINEQNHLFWDCVLPLPSMHVTRAGGDSSVVFKSSCSFGGSQS